MNQMRVRSMMAAALFDGKVRILRIQHGELFRILADRFRQVFRSVGAIDPFAVDGAAAAADSG